MKYRFLRFPEGKFKAVTFSYDDGVKADIRLASIFNQCGLKGTFNINTCHFFKGDAPNRMTVDEIKEHIDKGDKWVLRLESNGDFNKKIIFKDLVKD